MDTTGKNCTESDPEKYCRSPQCALHGTEYRTKARDIEKLYKKQFPLRHHYIVYTVIDTHCRCLAIVRSERIVYDFSVCKITYN